MIKCLKCGFEFDEGVFCPMCGTKHDSDKTIEPDSATTASKESQSEKQAVETPTYESAKQKTTDEEKKDDNESTIVGESKNTTVEKGSEDSVVSDSFKDLSHSAETSDNHNKSNENDSRKITQKVEDKLNGLNEKNAMSLAVLILGILSLPLCMAGIGVIPAIIAIILGIIDKNKNGKNKKTSVGMVCSIITIVLTIIMVIVIVYAIKEESKRDNLLETGQYSEALQYMDKHYTGSESHYYQAYVGLEQYDEAANYLLDKANKKTSNDELLKWDKEYGDKLNDIYDKVSDPVQLRIDEYKIRVKNAEEAGNTVADEDAKGEQETSELDKTNDNDTSNLTEEKVEEDLDKSGSNDESESGKNQNEDEQTNQEEETEEYNNEADESNYTVTIKVSYKKELLAYNNDVAIYVDGDKVLEIAAGATEWCTVSLSKGKHKIWASDTSKVRWLNKSGKEKFVVDKDKVYFSYKLEPGNFGFNLEEVE